LTDAWTTLAQQLEGMEGPGYGRSTKPNTSTPGLMPVTSASTLSSLPQLQKPIVPIGLRKFVQRVFRGNEGVDVAPIVHSPSSNSSTAAPAPVTHSISAQTSGTRGEQAPSKQAQNQPQPFRPVGSGSQHSQSALHSAHQQPLPEESSTPMNKVLQSKLQNLEEQEAQAQAANPFHRAEKGRGEDNSVLKNDVFRKQRQPQYANPSTPASQSNAFRKQKNKMNASADVAVNDDVFVVSKSQHNYEDLNMASSYTAANLAGSPLPSSDWRTAPFREQTGSSDSSDTMASAKCPESTTKPANSRTRTTSDSNVAGGSGESRSSPNPSTSVPPDVRPKASPTAVPTALSGAATIVTSSSSVLSDIRHKQQSTYNTEPTDHKLPDGWEAVRTEEGAIYYYHKITRVSRYVMLNLYHQEVTHDISNGLHSIDGIAPTNMLLQLWKAVSMNHSKRLMKPLRSANA
jgi:hypothetical protein